MTPLEELLQQCTVKITVPGGWGTGFFVASGLVLTCAHVVRRAADAPIALFYAARNWSSFRSDGCCDGSFMKRIGAE